MPADRAPSPAGLGLRREPEPAHVIRDGRRRDAESDGDRPLGQPLGVEAEDEVSARHEHMFVKTTDVSNPARRTRTAAGLGFEPRLTIPETVVLPLHHPAEY